MAGALSVALAAGVLAVSTRTVSFSYIVANLFFSRHRRRIQSCSTCWSRQLFGAQLAASIFRHPGHEFFSVGGNYDIGVQISTRKPELWRRQATVWPQVLVAGWFTAGVPFVNPVSTCSLARCGDRALPQRHDGIKKLTQISQIDTNAVPDSCNRGAFSG